MKFLFTILLSFSLFTQFCVHSDVCENNAPLHIEMHERVFTFSTYYIVNSNTGLQGNIIKSKLSPRTSYEYFDQAGNALSCAYVRMFSLGSVFSWATVMDVYDNNSSHLGSIEGSIFTLLPSKFCLYDASQNLCGLAYMDSDCMGFTISDPINSAKTVAHYHRVFVQGVTDYWTITIPDPKAVDLRILLAFGAFAVDHQSYFRFDD
jgi:hypothetical protein